MNNVHLNLARKWRSKAFDQIVGQELPVRMLKNSLYLGSFFPVYLFAGQRGCGKTSMARVFATAINCTKLPDFQLNPKANFVPCLVCVSCVAMASGKHPDFIEIDAASNTGVDNVRYIIDAASLLPVMGRKRIYLIDEAHMLSKAAYNAFLKILEEPPAGVLFILATTDAQKIIDTVKSRCFQLFFTPIDTQKLVDHLTVICTTEQIKFDAAALTLVVRATDGSARDAINLLEQVRFSASSVTKQAVLDVLGRIDDDRIIQLLEVACKKSPGELLTLIKNLKLELYAADYVWQKLRDYARALLWLKYDVELFESSEYSSRLKKLALSSTPKQINNILDLFYSNEQVFLRTTSQHAFLEMILLKLTQKKENDNSGASSAPQAASPSDSIDMINEISSDEEEEEIDEEEDGDEEVENMPPNRSSNWPKFLQEVDGLQDALLNSVFKQGNSPSYNQETKSLEVTFSKELFFFKDWIDDTRSKWEPLLFKAFGEPLTFKPLFTGEAVKKVATPSVRVTPHSGQDIIKKAAPAPIVQKNFQAQKAYPQKYSNDYNKNSQYKKKADPGDRMYAPIDISDINVWKKAHLLLHYFPGTIREMRESSHEQKS